MPAGIPAAVAASRSGPHRGRVPSATADDSRSQLLAQLSAALCQRTAVEHALGTWATAVRGHLEGPLEVGLLLARADGRTVQVATDEAAVVRRAPVPAAGTSGCGTTGWWQPVPAPEPFAAGALVGGPVVGGGSLLAMLLSRVPTDWWVGAGAASRTLVDDLRAVLGLVVGMEQAVLSVQDVDATLRSRAVIDQAVGVVMAHHGCGAEQAMHRLRRASQRSGVPVAGLAARLVTDVSGSPPATPTGFRVRRAATA